MASERGASMKKLGIMVRTLDEENISMIAEIGFNYSMFSWDESRDIDTIMGLFNKYNITVDNFHSPFIGINCIWDDCDEGVAYLERLKNCVLDAAKHGVKHVIVHPTAGAPEPHATITGINRFRDLILFATERGVKICFENLEYPEMLGVVMSEFEDLDIGFCYDVGHEACCTPGMRFMPIYGDKLCCTHIHDNYGMSYSTVPILHGDCHMIPFDATIDFERVMRDIKNSGYDGALSLETAIRQDIGTYVDIPVREYYEKAYAALVKLSEM